MRPAIEAARNASEGRPVEAVEVGVHEGVNAAEMLDEWPELRILHLVDNYVKSGRAPYEKALVALKAFPDRVRWHLTSSHVAAYDIPDGSLDLVYIDDDHSQKGILISMLAWIRKVKPGGIFGGHDWGRYNLNVPIGEILQPRGLTLHSDGLDWWTQIGVSQEPPAADGDSGPIVPHEREGV